MNNPLLPEIETDQGKKKRKTKLLAQLKQNLGDTYTPEELESLQFPDDDLDDIDDEDLDDDDEDDDDFAKKLKAGKIPSGMSLSELARRLRKLAKHKAKNGNGDNDAPMSLNAQLSEERAAAVVEELANNRSASGAIAARRYEDEQAKSGRAARIRRGIQKALADKSRPIGATDEALASAVLAQDPSLTPKGSFRAFMDEVRTIAKQMGYMDAANGLRLPQREEAQLSLDGGGRLNEIMGELSRNCARNLG